MQGQLMRNFRSSCWKLQRIQKTAGLEDLVGILHLLVVESPEADKHTIVLGDVSRDVDPNINNVTTA